MTQTRILLVDDLKPVLSAVAELLRDHFVIVGMVSHASEVLKAAEALSPEVIVMDISMPGISGIDITKELRLRGSQASIVFLTVPAIRDSLAGRVFLSSFPR